MATSGPETAEAPRTTQESIVSRLEALDATQISPEEAIVSRLEALAAAQISSEERVLSRLEALAASQGRVESSLARASSALDDTTATLAAVAGDVGAAVAVLRGQAPPSPKQISRTGTRSEPDAEAANTPHMPEPAGGTPAQAGEPSPRKRRVSSGTPCAGSKGASGPPVELPRLESRTMSEQDCMAWALPEGWPSTIALRRIFDPADMESNILDTRTFKLTSSVLSGSSGRLRRLRSPRERRQFTAISPNSKIRSLIGLMSVVVLVYDACAVPFMLAWEMPVVGALWATTIGTTCFWTVELLLSLVSGYHNSSGVIVTDLYLAARHYMTTWFLPDLLVLVCDWLSIVFVARDHNDNSARGLRMLRFTKVGRLLRVAGMLRMVKFAVAVEEQIEKRLSNTHRFLLKVISIFCGIFWVNHLLACAFFAIGRAAPSNTGWHWVDNVQAMGGGGAIVLLEEGILYQYMVSLHWSIAQITLGSMEVCTTNTVERAFNIGMLLLGLVFGCTLISALSGTMLEFQMMHKERQDTFRSLRIYLSTNRVGYELSQLVQRQAAERFGKRGSASARNVRALNFISVSLREELHFQICLPYIVRHPLLRLWSTTDETMCRRFCFDCVVFMHPMPGDDVFLPGAVAESCYHIDSGSLSYIQEPGSSHVQETTVTPVTEGRWLCESALWSQWIHVGRLEAETECRLLAVQPRELGPVLQRNRVLRDVTIEYSRQFHQRIVSAKAPRTQWPDDLSVPFTEYGHLIASAGTGVRTYIGLSALDEHAATSWSWHRGLAAGPGLEKLRAEVQEGRSVVTVNGSGDAERIVVVVALRLTRVEDGHIFAVLAKQEGPDAAVVPCCQLPGRKQEHGSVVGDTIRTILHHIGLSEADVEFGNVDRESEWRDSKEYGVRTKYLRTVCHAELQGEGIPSDMRMDIAVARQPSTPVSMRTKIDIIVRRDDCGKTAFYAWLAPWELEQLQTVAEEARLLDLLPNLTRGVAGRRRNSHGSAALGISFGSHTLGSPLSSSTLAPERVDIMDCSPFAPTAPTPELRPGPVSADGGSRKKRYEFI